MTNHQMQIIAEEFKIMKRAKFAEKYGLKMSTLTSRITLKPDTHISELIYRPFTKGRAAAYVRWNGVGYKMQDLADILHVNKSCLYQRLRKYDIHDIMSEAKAPRKGSGSKPTGRKVKVNPVIQPEMTEQDRKLILIQTWVAAGASEDQIKFRIRHL